MSNDPGSVSWVERTRSGIDPMLPKIYTVDKMRRQSGDTYTIEMNPADGGVPEPFSAGQFNMLYMFGVGEVPISISGDPVGNEPLRHTIRSVGTVTRAMADLRPGDQIGVRGPFGSHWPVEWAVGNDVIIAAGGIGLAPLRPVIYQVLANRSRYGRLCLLYGARTPKELLFSKELKKWGGAFDMDVHVTVDRGEPGWNGEIGVVTNLIRRAPLDRQGTVAMICGPEIMMRFTAQELMRRGVEQDRMYISLERNMKCGVGLCGHCQYGSKVICKDGPVYRYDLVVPLLGKREI
jgi:NAD(P)H-flavin reductase